MLYIALAVAAVLLIVVNLIAWRAERPVGMILAKTIAFGIASLGVCLIQLPPVLLQSILIYVAALIWGASRGQPRHFTMLSCFVTVVAFAIPAYLAAQQTRQLQETFAYVSMDERLPPAKKQRLTAALPATTTNRLTAMESFLEDKERDWPIKDRKSSLRQIHERVVREFVEQPGFGVTRMIEMKMGILKRGLRTDEPIPQPGTPSPSPWLAEQLKNDPKIAKTGDDILAFHRDSIADFINLAGFGYIKDRQHVAGFLEHRFSREPEPAPSWKLQTLDLIGLLLHEKPTAYVSDHLPRMKELRAAPMRDLDEFESAGLSALQRGDDLFVRERGQERRMLGAIRVVRQCLSCHQGERGDLLGAFSYRMTVDGK